MSPLPTIQPKAIRHRTIAEAKATIQAAIDTSDRAVYKALLLIYSKQTEGERQLGATIEDNGVGFSGCDAELLTSFAESLLKYGTLTPKQMVYARKKVRRYWRQLMILSKQASAAA